MAIRGLSNNKLSSTSSKPQSVRRGDIIGNTYQYNVATGGSVATVSNYNSTGQTWKVHTFTGNGTFSMTHQATPVNILVVAGGGGGAGGTGNVAQGAVGGSGGAGGAFMKTAYSLPPGSTSVVVGGAGGGCGTCDGGGCAGGSGGNSTVGSYSDLIAYGGGGGGANQGGNSGGSGGGGSSAIGNWGGPWGGGAGVAGQGTNGTSGGGQGSGGTGGAINLVSTITGSSVQYSVGAYGNRGGGGDWCTPGGSGGPGVVIIAYRVG